MLRCRKIYNDCANAQRSVRDCRTDELMRASEPRCLTRGECKSSLRRAAPKCHLQDAAAEIPPRRIFGHGWRDGPSRLQGRGTDFCGP